jgi:hypothetical protein
MARPEIASDVRGAAAAPAADLEHVLAREIDRSGNAMIELDAIALRLIGRIEGQRLAIGRFLGKAIVHKGPALGVLPSSRDGLEEQRHQRPSALVGPSGDPQEQLRQHRAHPSQTQDFANSGGRM